MSYGVSLPVLGRFDAWRAAARMALSHRIAPDQIDWTGQAGLFATAPLPARMGAHVPRVPAAFVDLARSVIWHRQPQGAALLYQVLWRLAQGDRAALSAADPTARQLQIIAKGIRRDIHKMHAFVRFHEIPSTGARRRFAAWFEPDHFIVAPAVPFFVKRFADMDWVIATPDVTAQFTAGDLQLSGGQPRPDLPADATAALWETYFANIFNPARVKLAAMQSEMPKKYWKNMPETRLIPAMLQDAEARVERMRAAGASQPRAGAAKVSARYRAQMSDDGADAPFT